MIAYNEFIYEEKPLELTGGSKILINKSSFLLTSDENC